MATQAEEKIPVYAGERTASQLERYQLKIEIWPEPLDFSYILLGVSFEMLLK